LGQAAREGSSTIAEHGDMLRMVESLPMRQFRGFVGDWLPDEVLQALIERSRRA
jgi:hypothetical protein